MAAPLASVTAKSLKLFSFSRISSECVPVTTCMYIQCRGKKHGAGASTRNQQRPTRGKYRGPRKADGQFVYKGEVLHRQLGLIMYPGENVGVQRNNTLYALRDGTLVVSCEKLQPYPDSPLYERIKDGMTIYKKFYNIYPTPVHANFKLVSEK